MAVFTRQLSLLSPDIIFKKTDSVLRGHIFTELVVQLKEMNLSRVLLVPANPALGRTIINKQYYLNGQPIHLSSFSQDPDFPVTSSYIPDMLRVNDSSVRVISKQETLPDTGIIVGEAQDEKDLEDWALRVKKDVLVAGAACFFEAILTSIGYKAVNDYRPIMPKFLSPVLFICGTAFTQSRETIKKLKDKGGPVSYMPRKMTGSAPLTLSDYQDWSREILFLLQTHGKAVMAIAADKAEGTTANDLREKMAGTVALVLEENPAGEFVMEGGATASAIIRRQGFNRLFPISELMPGVIRMAVEGRDDLYLTLKPGSYHWPQDLWNF
jgi:uncharacterized protein YgbK (DUF1537 family)